MDSARELHSCLKITISFSGRMPCSRASLATFFRRFASSGVGRSGRLSCSVNAVRNSFIVLSESELTALERIVSCTLSLGRRGWTFVQEYLNSTACALENPKRAVSSDCSGAVPILGCLSFAKTKRPSARGVCVRLVWSSSSFGRARFGDRGRVGLVFLEMPLVRLVYVLVLNSILLIGRDGVLLMLPVRVHAGLPSIQG